jgi:hypothetical protein
MGERSKSSSIHHSELEPTASHTPQATDSLQRMQFAPSDQQEDHWAEGGFQIFKHGVGAFKIALSLHFCTDINICGKSMIQLGSATLDLKGGARR